MQPHGAGAGAGGDDDDGFNWRLAEALFGKLSANEFRRKGPFPGYRAHKARLVRFVRAAEVEAEPAQAQRSATRQTHFVAILGSQNACAAQANPDAAPALLSSKNTPEPPATAPEVPRFRRFCSSHKVDAKYADHHRWLAGVFGGDSAEARSFRSLVRAAYSHWEPCAGPGRAEPIQKRYPV